MSRELTRRDVLRTGAAGGAALGASALLSNPGVLPLDDGSGLSIFAQPGYPGGFDGGHLYPFHLDSAGVNDGGDGNYGDHVLPYCKQYRPRSSARWWRPSC